MLNMRHQHSGRAYMAELRAASDELEKQLRQHLVPGVTLERLDTGQIRIRGGNLEWVGKIGDAPAELGNILITVGQTQKQADAVRALKLRVVPPPKPAD